MSQPSTSTHISRRALAVLTLTILAAINSCATNKTTLLPAGPDTMLDIWRAQTGGNGATLPREELARRPFEARAAAHQFPMQGTFQRLSNPDLVMYVFPHLAGGSAPIPGYTTVCTHISGMHCRASDPKLRGNADAHALYPKTGYSDHSERAGER